MKNLFKLLCLLTACLSFICVILFVLKAPSPVQQNQFPEHVHFPEGFLWGVTTAAYQVEGGLYNDWTAAGIDAKQAVRHFDLWKKDLQHMKKMGLKSYRFSIAWERIQPEPDQWNEEGIQFYVNLVKALKAEGIEPVVTLWHFTQPVWFAQSGGWENPQNGEAYLKFVEKIVPYLADDVKYWITLNEPMVYVVMAYFKGDWPPYITSYTRWIRPFKHLLQAHGRAYRKIHLLDPNAQVSLAKNIAILEPYRFWNPLDHLAQHIYNRLFNHSAWNAIEKGHLGFAFPFYVGLEETPELKDSLDWVAVHYYSRYFITGTGKLLNANGKPASYFGRDIYAEGLYTALEMADQRAKKRQIPIMITENGIEDASDRWRSHYLYAHLKQIWRAQHEGIDVKGYYHWTFTDNFEWKAGYEPKFGLLDKHRQWKPSAKVYQNIIQNNGFTLSETTPHTPHQR